MNKPIKMVIYGEPGVGKSVFASKAPKPFFITTDGNYEWLAEFGAKEEDHIQVNTWSEVKKAFRMDFSKYETIVLDLTEDSFKWCEYEFCKKHNVEHVGDIGGYGKGYDMTRNEFFIELCGLLNLNKNIILIMHGLTTVTKDRRGVEIYKYIPTNRIPDKVMDMIEGRVRYFLRAYLRAEEINGKLVKKRYLSLVPKENEFGICRGIDENTVPSDIPLDWDTFVSTLGLDGNRPSAPTASPATAEEKPAPAKPRVRKTVVSANAESASAPEEPKPEPKEEPKPEPKAEPKPEPAPVATPASAEEAKPAVPATGEQKKVTNNDKLAALMARINKNKGAQ